MTIRTTLAWKTLAASALIILLTWLIHGDILHASWRFDDGNHLWFAAHFSPVDYFFDPRITRAFSHLNLTPWNPFPYAIDLSLFGFSPGGFYLHHLLSLMLAALATFLLLRLWLEHSHALLGAVAFLLGAPTVHIAQKLMVGHYLDGLSFAILSLFCFVLALRRKQYRWLLAGVLLYLLATSCKEIYVPLPGLLLFLPESRWGSRVRYALPWFAWLLVYVLWRHRVLGSFVGGHRDVYDLSRFWEVVSQLGQLPLLLFGVDASGMLGIGALLLLALWALLRRKLRLPLLLVVLLLLLPPLVALAISPGISSPNRYLFLLWWATSVLIATAVAGVGSGRSAVAAWLLSGLVLVAAGLQAFRERARLQPALARSEQLYAFALSGAPDPVLLVRRQSDPFYLNNMLNRAIAARAARNGEPAYRVAVVRNRRQLARLDRPPYTLWEYREECQCVQPVAAGSLPSPGRVGIPPPGLLLLPYGPPYPPKLGGAGGVVEHTREGARLSVSGWLPLGRDEPEQWVTLITPEQPLERRIEVPPPASTPTRPADPAAHLTPFRITLRFADSQRARRAAKQLCVIGSSALTPPWLVPDPANSECQDLLLESLE